MIDSIGLDTARITPGEPGGETVDLAAAVDRCRVLPW
jgi:hypothetical protein